MEKFCSSLRSPFLYRILNPSTKQKDALPEKPATTDAKSEITKGVVERHFCLSGNQKFIVLFRQI
ncbi:hypothetical protein ACE1CC_10605 [Aerosakkonemataceae cyanobacterium BLCC-F46]|uniref:Uncharacterized protein n=1 Tax=Floridaenema aerugineum BLCC-F46 TaxID=3153654 RepID=A0ABV4X3G4_9CYAN